MRQFILRPAPPRWRRRLGRVAFLALGALLSAPYVLVTVWAAELYRFAAVNPIAPVFATAVGLGLFAVPASLRVTAALERTASDELLGTRLGAQTARAELSDVLRAAAWFAAHLGAGLLFAVVLVVLVPLDVLLVLTWAGIAPSADIARAAPGFDGPTTAVLVLVGTAACGTLLVGVGTQLPRWAVLLLGPSTGQRLALAERSARLQAQRNRLARELHDSVGHALAVTTLQAAAARAHLRDDPDAAETALEAVEETGRRAQAELDAALAILRDPTPDPGRDGSAAQPPGLDELDALIGSFRAAGLAVETDLSLNASVNVPDVVSHEAYRLLQEALTNALRHGAGHRASLRMTADHGVLRVHVDNPFASQPGEPLRGRVPEPGRPGGLGLIGLRERIVLLGGRLEAGPRGALWAVDGELPLGAQADAAHEGAVRW
ncbi:histidine kinase [Sinomonas sp. ASV322]|uniref:sensor histidine kinase n=1 Tax=Sinomonas sp. ASV322 TaxID=3041920 RepID=UPI0027DB5C7C|nr:histidine kinase [Sinomonas sp. ASV322]MDQ4500891.1 histidine kinase [Sinomonas sp. ASV322]